MAGGNTERRRRETRRRRRGIRGGLRGRGAVGLDKIEVTRPLFDQVHEAVMEAKAFLEARQRANKRNGGREPVDINADAGGPEASRILDRLLAEQEAA